MGHAFVQAVSRHLPTVEAGFRALVRTCGICGFVNPLLSFEIMKGERPLLEAITKGLMKRLQTKKTQCVL
jgi:hypothetical protein